MSEIDTSSWKEFKFGDILEKVDCAKLSYKKADLPVEAINGYIPARTATTLNQGLSCYVPRKEATVLRNVISVSANGDFCAFWHEEDFTILQDSYALTLKDSEFTTGIGLFLTSCLNSICKDRYNWNNKSGWNKIKEEKVKLPVIKTEEIDWEYMSHYIEELEQERVEELDKYLRVTGLNDYVLTEEDKVLLATELVNTGGD